MPRRYCGMLGLSLLILASGVGAVDETDADSASPAPGALERALAELDRQLPADPSPLHHRRAEVLFRLGRYAEAVDDYTTAARGGRPHDDDSCWERGLAQYYAGDFRGGAEQFARYHQVGATDIENGLWYFLCVAMTDGVGPARKAMFAYPRKRGAPFPALLALYLGQGDAEAVLAEADDATVPESERRERLFYAHYYLGKYYQLFGPLTKARFHIEKSLTYPLPHFMYICAEADLRRLNSDDNSAPRPERSG